MMSSISFLDWAKATHGIWRDVSDAAVSSLHADISIDTRTINAGEVYLALKGENFDGHGFVSNAVEKGCVALIVSEYMDDASVPQLLVEDTREALSRLAELNRNAYEGSLIALTGSSGKTSTKEIIKHLLSSKAPTLATEGNLNNEIGVPLTLLKISDAHEFAVIEMGARHLGDIRQLTVVAKPDIALLLNAGSAHIDVFGSYENIVKGKGEIYESLNDQGCAIVNLDDPAHEYWQGLIGQKRTIGFSLKGHNQASLCATDVQLFSDCSEFDLSYENDREHIKLPAAGKHAVANALAACSVAVALGMSLAELVAPLASLGETSGRLCSQDCGQFDLIDDSYNANPASVKAAIDVLELKSSPRFFVLGEMAELGEESRALHLEVAKYYSASSIEYACYLGRYAEEMALVDPERSKAFPSKQAIAAFIEQKIKTETGENKAVILVKGSRSAQMEELIDMLDKRAA